MGFLIVSRIIPDAIRAYQKNARLYGEYKSYRKETYKRCNCDNFKE